MVPHHYSRFLNKESRPESSLPPRCCESKPAFPYPLPRIPKASSIFRHGEACSSSFTELSEMQTATFGEDEVRCGLDEMTSLCELLVGEYHVLFLCSRSLIQHLAPLLDGGTDVFLPQNPRNGKTKGSRTPSFQLLGS